MVNVLAWAIGDGDAVPSSYNIMNTQLLMRSALLFIGLTTLLSVSCAQPDAPPAEVRTTADAGSVERSRTADRATSARPRIVFLGDSLTAGYGLAKEESVPLLIQARLQANGYRYERRSTRVCRGIRRQAGSAVSTGRSKET